MDTTNKEWTCSCMYKCYNCKKLEENGMSKQDFYSIDDDDRPSL